MFALPGPGPGPFARRFSQHCRIGLRRLATHLALSGPAQRCTSLCGAGAAGSAGYLILLAAVPSAVPEPGEENKVQQSRNSNSNNSSSGSGNSGSTGAFQFGHDRRRVTDTLLVLNCVCMMLQWLSQGLLTFWGAKINSYILEGQVWRLITPTFLHSGLAHLMINSYALNSVGPEVEYISGGPRFLSIYLMSAFTGTVASFAMTPQPSLGSSGAIFGIAAALGLFYWRHQDTLGKTSDKMLRQLGITAAINIGCSLFIRNIDNWGHVGGLVGGVLVAWLLGPVMKRNEAGRFVDQPPLAWLASPQGHTFGERPRRRAIPESTQGSVPGSSERDRIGTAAVSSEDRGSALAAPGQKIRPRKKAKAEEGPDQGM